MDIVRYQDTSETKRIFTTEVTEELKTEAGETRVFSFKAKIRVRA